MYYFLSCDGSVCYVTPQADWLNAFIQAPTVGIVYLLENITDLPDGCYECVNTCESPTTFSGYQISSSRTIAESGCLDDICSVSPAPTICAERCDTPGVVYQITGYTGSSIVNQSFHLDFSDYTGCYIIVSECGESPIPLDITSQTTVDYENCDACNPPSSPTPTPSETYHILACCNDPSRIVWLSSTDPVFNYFSIASVGQTYLLDGVASNHTCVNILAFNVSTYPSPATHTIVPTPVGIIQRESCDDFACIDCGALIPINSPSQTPTPTVTPTTSITPSNTITPTPTPSNTPSARWVTSTPTVTPTTTPSNTVTPTNTPTTSVTTTPTITPSTSAGVSPTPTSSVTQSLTPTLSVTPTPTPSSSEITSVADKLESCETNSLNQKVFVFYDGTSLSEESASGASESIRSWYQTKVDDGDLLSGNLYEGVIGLPGYNGENWLWWASYPYLGSLTGGTVSGTTIYEFDNEVPNSEIGTWCKSSSVSDCNPKNSEFNDSSDTYRRINRGRQFTGSFTTDDPRSNGVPFDQNQDLNNSGNSGPGIFEGKETNYIVIIVADESDGYVGLYHGRQTKSQLYTNPFELLGDGWDNDNGGSEYTDRFKHDYESYLKVWEDVKSSGGTINGLIYPVIDNSTTRMPFVQHSVASIEGDTISEIDFNTKYGDNSNTMVSMGPEDLVLTALTHTNVYSGLTGTTTYQNLNPQYQNGSGLKNFGFSVDPKVSNFTEEVVSESLNDFLLDIEQPVSTLYLVPQDKKVGQVYQISGDCYTVTEINVSTSEPIISPIDISGPYTDCDNCGTSGCYSATTDGYHTFTDCCGEVIQGEGVGLQVCVDTNYPYQGIAVSADPCVQNCDQGPLDYTFAVTGVCENLGQGIIEILPIGGIKPYTLQNTSPGSLLTQTGNGPFYWNNLSAGTYIFRLNDSSGGENQDLFINVIVDGCFCANIDNVSGTTCGDDTTGELNVNGSSNSLPYNIELYRNGVLNQTVSSPSQTYGFSNLPSGIYYAFVTDFGGATAQTESVVIEESVELDFGLFTIDESPCIQGNGSATVTGLTGTGPYTYLWSDGQTTSTATGLTQGDYSVTVTDSLGCVKFNEFNIGFGEPIGVASVIPTQANCFSCDGQLLVTITGGTAPYSYVGSNGQTLTTQSKTFLMSNLCSGAHSVIVTDAGSCQTTALGTVISTAGFSVVSINVTNSDCGQSGSIQININAPQGIFTYTLTDDNGSSQSITTSSQTYTFSNLDSGTYDIEIQFNSDCIYTTQKTVANEDKFTVVSSITGATCGQNNGQIQVFVSEGSQTLKYPFDYILTNVNLQQVVYQQIDVNDIEPIISNIASGTYLLTVTDNENCTVSKTLNISQTNGVDFSLSKTDCVLGDDGTATVTIYNGEPPFTYTWSSNLPSGESGGSVSNLPGGTYTVTVTDSNGCNDTKSVTINCDNNRVTCYELNSICEQDFITTSGNKRGFEEMLNEAFFDLTSGHTNCNLVESIFYVNIGITGTTGVILNTSQSFYTGTTLSDYPDDSDWVNIINTILSTVTEIESFSLDVNTNQLTIISNCDGDEDPLRGAQFSLGAKVELTLICDSDGSTPTLTPTPTNTPGSSNTPTLTPTVSNTPTMTPSNSQTPTPTNVPTGTNTPTPTPTNTNTPTNTGTPTSTPNVTPSNTGTPAPTPEVTPSHTPTNTPTPTQGCKCLEIDTNITYYATGNTGNNPNNVVEIDYFNCDNVLVTFSATTAVVSLGVFYLCTHDGVVEEVRSWQDDVLYTADTFNFPPYEPNGWNPSMTYNLGIPSMNYGSFGSCAGDPCGTTPTPTPSITETATPTPTPSITETATPTPTPTSSGPSISPSPTPSQNYVYIYFSGCCETDDARQYKMKVTPTLESEINQLIVAGRTTLYLQYQTGIDDQCVSFYAPGTGTEPDLGIMDGEFIGNNGNPWNGDPNRAYLDCDECTSSEEHPCPQVTNYVLREVLYGSSCSEVELDYVASSSIGPLNVNTYVKVSQDNKCYIVKSTTTATPTLTVTQQNASCELCNTGVVSMIEINDFNNCTGPVTLYYGDISGLSTPPQNNEVVKGTNLVCYMVQSYVDNTPNVTLSGGPWNSCVSCQA